MGITLAITRHFVIDTNIGPDGYGRKYVAVGQQYIDDPHIVADANLIVASPELLTQLEIAVASGKSWHGISEARAAIAKARGQNV